MFATVTNRDGRLVTTLARDAFEVRDEGKPQPITQFDNTPQPIRLIVMLDGPPLAKLEDVASGMPVAVHWANRGENAQQLQMAFVETSQPRDAGFRKLLSAHLSALTS